MLVSVAGAVHADGQMGEETGTLLPVPFPLQSGGQKHPRFTGFIPESVFANRIRREGDDFAFMLGYPVPEVSKRDFILLPVAIGQMDGRPISSPLSKRFAVRELEQGAHHTFGLKMDPLRRLIDAAPMIQLAWIVQPGFGAQPLGQR